MKRKVIQIANSTQLVSLPRKWAIENNIKKGDELEIEVKPNSLMVMATSEREPLNITVDVEGLEPFLVDRFLARAYQKGYDLINLKFTDPEILMTIQTKMQEFLGFEILHQTKQGCEVKSISSKLDVDFDTIFRKAFLIIMDMIDITAEAFSKGDKKTLKNIYVRDFEVNKFVYFCLRELNKFHKPIDGMGITYFLVETLEDVGDDIKRLAEELAEIKKPSKEVIKVVELIKDTLKNAYEFFYKPTKALAQKGIDNYKELDEEIVKLMSTHKETSENRCLLLLWELNRLTYHYITMRLDTLQELSVKRY